MNTEEQLPRKENNALENQLENGTLQESGGMQQEDMQTPDPNTGEASSEDVSKQDSAEGLKKESEEDFPVEVEDEGIILGQVVAHPTEYPGDTQEYISKICNSLVADLLAKGSLRVVTTKGDDTVVSAVFLEL